MRTNIVITVLMGILLISCGSPQQKEQVLLTPQAFSDGLQQDKTIALIDLRSSEERSGGFIQGAYHYDFNAGNFEKALDSFPKSQTYYLYCAGGGRSGKALDQMKARGFEKVTSLDGGFKRWSAEGMPVTKP